MNNPEQETESPPEWLEEIANEFAGKLELKFLSSVGSTNTWLKDQVSSGSICGKSEACPVALIADRQTAGRGTRGRSWIQPGAQGEQAGPDLALSALLPRQSEVLLDTRLSLLVAAIVIRALNASRPVDGTAVQVGLATRWPNDILGLTNAGWRKLGGILIETCQDRHGDTWVVIGIGLNLSCRAADFPPDLAGQVTTLRDLVGALPDATSCPDRQTIVSHLLPEILEMSGKDCDNPAILMKEWQAVDQTGGRRYLMKQGDRKIPVQATGVDSGTGALLVETETGQTHHVISYTDLEAFPEAGQDSC